jgi:transferase hexapeptide repeat protein
MKRIAIFGSGGMGREAACTLQRINRAANEEVWQFVGFYDDGLSQGSNNEMGKVLGGSAQLNAVTEPLAVVLAFGSPQVMRRVRQAITNPNVYFPNIIDPTVELWHAPSFTMGEGNLFMPHCVVSCNVRIGSFNLFNGDASIRHDVQVGSFNTFMPGVRLSGGVKVGDGNFFGLNSAVVQYKCIGNDTQIGAAAVVMDDTADYSLYVGVPAGVKRDLKVKR